MLRQGHYTVSGLLSSVTIHSREFNSKSPKIHNRRKYLADDIYATLQVVNKSIMIKKLKAQMPSLVLAVIRLILACER